MNISGFVERHARFRAHCPAVVFESARLDWDAFGARVRRLAQALSAHGVAAGDRVATVLGNHLELLDIYWACAQTGAVCVPLSPLLMQDGLCSLLGDAAPRVIFASAPTAPAVQAACIALREAGQHSVRVLVDGDAQPLPDGFVSYAAFCAADATAAKPGAVPPKLASTGDVDPDALYNIMYTSGTTGMPKGIMLSHRVRATYATLFANAWRMTPESVVLHTGAIVFNGAFLTLLPAFMLGACYILHRQFDAQAFIECVERERVSHTFMVPAQISAVLNCPAFAPEKLASLQMIGSVGAPLPVAQKEQLDALLPGRFTELYGLTEGFMSVLDRVDAVRKRGSVGAPMMHTDIRVVDAGGDDLPAGEVGEIIGRGPMLMRGYYQRPDLTAAALREGWLYSGDMGYLDSDGYLYLVDRKKDMIDTGGIKVYPRDVEEVVARHPAVAEVVVFGIPDEKWGETPVAAVLLKETFGGTAPPDAEALKTWINARVAARYQRVSHVDIVSSFPRNAAGKILKRELREAYWKGREMKI